MQALVVGSTGVTWFLGTLAGAVGGQPFMVRMRYTHTWVHDDQEGWRIDAAHASAANE